MTIRTLLISVATAATTASLISLWLVSAPKKTDPDKTLDKEIKALQMRIEYLEIQLMQLQQTLNQNTTPLPEQNVVSVNQEEPTSIESEALEQSLNQQTNRQAQSIDDIRHQQLLRAGFESQQADWVLQQRREVELDQLKQQHRIQRRQAQQAIANGTLAKSAGQLLKDRLGEALYERYLAANGYPTAVNIANVLSGSAADSNGLRAGDRILRYDGQRVYNIQELTSLTLLGDEGQNVLLDIEREGSPIQVTLPRGPIGITTSRREFR